MEPVIWLASSERMSPNMLLVAITSNWPGFRTSCMAALSTYMKESSTSGYWPLRASATSRHRRLDSRMLALSTTQSFLRRFMADSNPSFRIRSISGAVYFSVSQAVCLSSLRPRSPK